VEGRETGGEKGKVVGGIELLNPQKGWTKKRIYGGKGGGKKKGSEGKDRTLCK